MINTNWLDGRNNTRIISNEEVVDETVASLMDLINGPDTEEKADLYCPERLKILVSPQMQKLGRAQMIMQISPVIN